VEFYTHAEALASMRYISGTKLDERIIRCDLDLGYRDGRQFGRGKSGGQVCTSNSCILLRSHTLNDATNLRCEMSIDKTMMREEEDGVPRRRDRKSKGDARSRNAMQMRTRMLQWQLAVKSGSMRSHPRKQLINVLGHPMTKMTVLDSAPESMKIPDGCSFLLYFCILS